MGDTRTIEFDGGTHDDHPLRIIGGQRSGDDHSRTDLTVLASAPGRVVFGVDRDDTMLARWARLDRAVVTWRAIDATRTRVTWRLEYQRLLQPTAYFAPLQRFGMDRAACYLLEAAVVEQLP